MNKDIDKTCIYCGEHNGYYGLYWVRKAVKPKFSKNRWKHIGYCCDSCLAKGKEINIEFKET